MDLKEYTKFVKQCPLYDDVIYGLIGELGEIVEPYKKYKRPGAMSKLYDREKMKLEIGDVFWYLTRFCIQERFDLDEILELNVKKLTKRHEIVD